MRESAAAAYSKKICKAALTKQISKFTKNTPEWSFQTGPSFIRREKMPDG